MTRSDQQEKRTPKERPRIEGGWFRAAAKLPESAIFALGSPTPLHLWILLLARAHRGRRPYKTEYGPIRYGECRTSLRRLEADLSRGQHSVHHTTIRRWLRWLEKEGMIEVRRVGQGGIIVRAKNYAEYQDWRSYLVSRGEEDSSTSEAGSRNTFVTGDAPRTSTENGTKPPGAQHLGVDPRNTGATQGRSGQISTEKREGEAPSVCVDEIFKQPPATPPVTPRRTISLDTEKCFWTGLTDQVRDGLQADLREAHPEIDEHGVLDRALKAAASYWCDAIAEGRELRSPRAAMRKGVEVYLNQQRRSAGRSRASRFEKPAAPSSVDPLVPRALSAYREVWTEHHNGVVAPETRRDEEHATQWVQTLRSIGSAAPDDKLAEALRYCLDEWMKKPNKEHHPIGFIASRLPGWLSQED